jgi:MFS family permease
MRRLVVSVYALLFFDEILLLGIVPLAPTFKDEYGLSETEAGLLLASASIATVLVAIPAGVLADRVGARRLTLAGVCVLAAGALGQGLADSFWVLLAARFVFGAGSAVLWTAGTAWLSDSVPANRRSAALGAVMAVAGIGAAVGPSFAGFLAEEVDISAPFLIGAALVAAAIVGVATAGRGGRSEHEPQPVLATYRAGLRERLVLGGLVITVLAGFSDGVVGLLAPLQLDENGLSAGSIGAAFSVAAAIFLLGSTALIRAGDAVVTLGVAAVGSVLVALTILPLLASTATSAVIAGVVVRATGVAVLYTISFPLATQGAHRIGIGRGSAIGLMNLGWGSASLSGPLVGGALAETVGARAGYALVLGLSLVAAAWLVVARAAERGRPPLDAAVSAPRP